MKQQVSLSKTGWALLLLIFCLAFGFRFWQLGEIPSGLYRDEAHNGLDALEVLQGNHAVYFSNNNGREPAYIYLTAFFVNIFGRTAFAVRVGAAVIGTITTLFVYLLANSWFDKSTAFFAAFLWAITVWPVHLSRIGLRAILIPFILTLLFYIGTLAVRKSNRGLWLLTGVVYGLGFYTYLPIRLTPAIFAVFIPFYFWQNRESWQRNKPYIFYSIMGFLLALSPFIVAVFTDSSILFGRSNQVSIFNPVINGGNLLGTALSQFASTLGLFFVRGDDIIRHNPSGRPLFDVAMAVAFLLGVWGCARGWGKSAVKLLFLWISTMLIGTFLAEDAPHFLRSVGILPAALFLPAIGLSQLWSWPKLHINLRQLLVLSVCVFSMGMSVKDYFVDYATDPNTGYLFESAVHTLTQEINSQPQETAQYIDKRFAENWPSFIFLLDNPIITIDQKTHQNISQTTPSKIYTWPHAEQSFITSAIPKNSTLTIKLGDLGRGDLETVPYPIYLTYQIDTSISQAESPLSVNQIGAKLLTNSSATLLNNEQIQIDLYWSTDKVINDTYTTFIHLYDGENLVTQNDQLSGFGYWSTTNWQPTIILHEQLVMPVKSSNKNLQIFVGQYNTATTERVFIQETTATLKDNSVQIPIKNKEIAR